MSLADLIKKRPLSIATAISAIPATHQAENLLIVSKIAIVAAAKIPKNLEPVQFLDTEMKARRESALTMLADNPELRLAVVCDSAGDPVKLAVAIRDKGSVEVLIPAARFDPFALLTLIDKHKASETLH